ncbi:hypothetical protein McpSp1_10150 [Methanocorpusculaceae archaeon Sp1]|nr:hypothetical protein [Methanocorpusculaceae archaeon Sp1]
MITEEDSIICPDCGHEQQITICPSVNVTTDPELREKVLSGEIFLFTCDECGCTGFAGHPFVYEDKETAGGFLIYLEPDCPDRIVGVDGDIADQVIYREKPMRLVADLNALKEKIFIFEADLDDRVMELFKMLTLTKLSSDNPDQVPDHLLFTKIQESEEGRQIVLAAFKENKYLGVLELPYSLYQTCVVTGGPIWDVPTVDCMAVDQEWIAERLKCCEEEEEEEEKEEGCGESDHAEQ